jgi:hypothetical protein
MVQGSGFKGYRLLASGKPSTAFSQLQAARSQRLTI